MKITKLILDNYAAIKKALNTNHLEIDFSKSKNNICLIIGPNGSGKTTLLSLLNPFATLGNLDIRDGLGLIIDGKNGYKEIHYKNNNDEYVIKHYYTHQKDRSHSVKSYIEKNGDELNPNGNVTSFKEIVKEELDVELDYLKLIRLGANVTNLIDLSETERKNYMGKLLDDIGIYLTYYKKVNNDIRQLKDMISHLIDKINKLNVDSREDVNNEIAEYESNKNSIQNNIYNIIGELSVLKNKISEIHDTDNLKQNLSENSRILSKMKSVLAKKNVFGDTDLEKIKNKIDELKSDNQKYKANIEACDLIINHMNESLDSELNRYHSLMINLDREKNIQDEISKLESEKRKCEDDILFSFHDFETSKPTISKSSFDEFVVFLKNTQEMLNTTYEYGKNPIRKVISLIKNDRNVNSYIITNTSFTNEDDSLSLFMHKLASFNITEKDFDIDNLPCGEYKCKFKQLGVQIYNLLNSRNLDSDSSPEFIHDVEIVWNVISKVLEMFRAKKDIIMSLPENIKSDFTVDALFNKMSNLEKIYNDVEINGYLSFITAYELYNKRLADADALNKEINYRKQISNIDNINLSIAESSKIIHDTKESISSYRNTIIENKEIIENNIKELESLEEWYESCTKFDDVQKRQDDLDRDYTIYKESKDKINILEKQLYQYNHNLSELDKMIDSKKTSLIYFDDYNKELKKYNKIYDDMIFIKDALSSKKGIPLHYMALYLGNTEEITNELLDIAYDGDIYIDKFNITPTEFTIPFYNKGTLIRDVKYASQGELSFLSIALSFALATQAMSKYNIMLLDEIDGPLDQSNRVKFINVLENQIDRISSEQNFLITHNDMFSGYPIDIIDLSFENNNDKYPLAYYIPLKK